MKKLSLFSAVAAVLATSSLCLCAQDNDPKDLKKVSDAQADTSSVRIAQETNLSYSYVGAGDIKQGNSKLGKVDEQNSDAKYVVSPEISDGFLFRAGMEWERYSFGLPGGAPMPNTLQSTNLILGCDIQVADQWLMRIEAAPGIYSDFVDISTRDINAPVIIGGSYLVSKDLQWVAGLSIDLWRKDYPVLPGAGVRWKFADQWVLDAILPKPRLEYELERSTTLYLGLDLKGGTYMTSSNFGNDHGRGNLNQTPVEYNEVRVGGGVSWKPTPFLSLEGETGASVYREFDYAWAHTHMISDEPAPYVAIALIGSF